MKKLMFGAAIAATSMVFAATPEGQVYDVCLSIKTTAAATATVNNKQNPLAIAVGDEATKIVYRKQASATWKGLIWGCSCETINGVWEYVQNTCDGSLQVADTVKGCVIWDTKTKTPVFMGDGSDLSDPKTVPGTGFGWNFIHAIDKDAKKVEGTWSMTEDGEACNENTTTFSFAGAGFGTSCLVTTAQKDADGKVLGYDVECTSYIKSISGNFAGWMKAPYTTVSTDWSGCTFCGFKPGTSDCEYADAWDWCKWTASCDCDTQIDENLDRTAAYGTWSVKYNSSLSKKLSQPVKSEKDVVVSIRDVYNFKSLPYVAAAIKAVENVIWEIPTDCDVLETTLAKATTALKQANDDVDEAEAGVVAVSREVLTAKRNAAKADLQYATEQYELKKPLLDEAYERALYQQTNVNAVITSTNAVGAVSTATTVGCAELSAKIVLLEAASQFCVKIETTVPGLVGTRTCNTWEQGKALVKEFTDATEAAKAAIVTAELVVQTATDDLAIAENNLANCDILTIAAEEALDKAQTVQATALKAYEEAEQAYEDAGCND